MATKHAADANRRAAAQARASGRAGGPGRRIALVVGAVVALAAVVAIAVSVATDAGNQAEALEDRAVDVTVEGSPLPMLPEAGMDPAVGAPFPTFRGTGADGAPLTIEAGEPTILVLLAHWCPVCQREVPVLVDWLADGGPEGVEVVALSTSFQPTRGNWPSTQWLADEGWQQPTLLDPDGAAFVAVGGRAFPGFVAIDADGTVVARTVGELSVDELEALAALARG